MLHLYMKLHPQTLVLMTAAAPIDWYPRQLRSPCGGGGTNGEWGFTGAVDRFCPLGTHHPKAFRMSAAKAFRMSAAVADLPHPILDS